MTDTDKTPPTLREAVASVIAEAHAEGPSAMADPKCHLRKVLMTVGYLQDLNAAHEAPGAYENSAGGWAARAKTAEAERDDLYKKLGEALSENTDLRDALGCDPDSDAVSLAKTLQAQAAVSDRVQEENADLREKLEKACKATEQMQRDHASAMSEKNARIAELREKLRKAEHQTSGCCPQSEELARANAELREKLEADAIELQTLAENTGLFERLGEPLLPPARPSFGDGSDAGGERDFSDPPKDREGDVVLRDWVSTMEDADYPIDFQTKVIVELCRRALGGER